MTNNPLVRKTETHAVLVGQTGTGKSTLARMLFDRKRRSIIIDPKGDMKLPPALRISGRFAKGNTLVATHPDQASNLIRKRKENILYRPSGEFLEPFLFDDIFRACYNAKNCDVYIDELSMVTKSANSYPAWLRALYQQGRSRGIRVFGATQRPATVPVFCFSEAGQLYCFRLTMTPDKRRIREWMGDGVGETNDKHSFYYRDVQSQEPAHQFVLELQGE
jgi:hypothetical protein